jgi:hypothetical protein
MKTLETLSIGSVLVGRTGTKRHPDWTAMRVFGGTRYLRVVGSKSYAVEWDAHRNRWTLDCVEECRNITEAHTARFCIQSLDAALAKGVTP